MMGIFTFDNDVTNCRLVFRGYRIYWNPVVVYNFYFFATYSLGLLLNDSYLAIAMSTQFSEAYLGFSVGSGKPEAGVG